MKDRFERIKQKATEIKGGEFCFDGGNVEIVNIEVFAELLVLECAVIVGSLEEPHQDIAKTLKQHFGLEPKK